MRMCVCVCVRVSMRACVEKLAGETLSKLQWIWLLIVLSTFMHMARFASFYRYFLIVVHCRYTQKTSKNGNAPPRTPDQISNFEYLQHDHHECVSLMKWPCLQTFDAIVEK